MKTNANPKTIISAVENVSKTLYEGNVVFRKYPEKLTRNLNRFTLRTKDSNKKGSLITKEGVKQPKADWNVHQDVMKEILRLDPRPTTYVDTIYGREYGKGQNKTVLAHEPELQSVESNSTGQPRQKRKYTRRKPYNEKRTPKPTNGVNHNGANLNGADFNVINLVNAIKYIIQHPEVLTAA